MKKLYIALSFAAISSSIYAQNNDTKSADKLFARYEYVKAANAYLKLVENDKADGYVYKQLADSYYNMFNTTEAVKWYAKAMETNQDAETYFRYSQMLKANGKYEESNKVMSKFAAAYPNDLRAKSFKENPNYIPKLLKKSPEYTVSALAINSEKSEFGALLKDNNLFFTSARNAAKKNYGWNNEPYLDLYKSTLGDGGNYSEPTAIASLNSQYHDGPITFSTDGKTAYFSSDSFRENLYTKNKAAHLKLGKNNLYKATSNDGETWNDIKPLPFNSAEYSTSNPALSKDGRTLYFSSDMPGGKGGVDIWKVEIKADGSFGTPVCLGGNVNTEGNESFPFIAEDNKTLYFSSNGKQGLGGYDVFSVDLSKNSEAVNLGKPVNSEKDDFSFTFNGSKNFGYFSSNRNGNDDIFTATPICGVDVETIVTNSKTGEILAGAKVSILDSKNNVIATETSNDKGAVSFRVECDQAYTVQVSKDKYEGNTFAIAKSKGPKATVDAKLNPIEEIVTPIEVVLQPIYFEFDKSNITQQGAFELDKLVQVMNDHKDMVIFVKSHTDNIGDDDYNLGLSDRRAKASVQYVISKGISADRISGQGFGEKEPVEKCDRCTKEQNAKNRRSEFLIVKK